MSPSLRVVLDENDFRLLVSGGVFKRGFYFHGHSVPIEIRLADIGFDRMIFAIGDALENVQTPGSSIDHKEKNP